MPDLFIGTAILDRSMRPQQLHLVGRRHDGKLFETSLPVFPKGSKELSKPSWEYECHGNTLHMRPSVRIRNRPDGEPDYFHNEGFWIIRFEDGRHGNLYESNKSILPAHAPQSMGGFKEY